VLPQFARPQAGHFFADAERSCAVHGPVTARRETVPAPGTAPPAHFATPDTHFVAIRWPGRGKGPNLAADAMRDTHHAEKGTTMELLTDIAEHALAASVLAGLALPVLAARLILAFDTRRPRLFPHPPAIAAPVEAVQPRRLRLRSLPAPAVPRAAALGARPAQSGTAPGLAPRWKGAHRLAIGV
jgi:hypothetical protein